MSATAQNGKQESPATASGLTPAADTQPFRRRLPDERQAITHHFAVGGHEGYLTVGLYDNGQPGEIFLTMAKEGSTVSGLMDSFATAVSLALQYGVPLKVLCNKLSHTRFEPSGFTNQPEIGYAKSLMDYIFRWLALKFLSERQPSDHSHPGPRGGGEATALPARAAETTQPPPAGGLDRDDAPACHECGAIMVANGSCYRCLNCGSTSGCS